MLKNLIPDFKKELEKLSKKKDSLPKLEHLQAKISKELNKSIATLYLKKEMLKEVIFRKKELKLQKLSVLQKIHRAPWGFLIRCFISMPFIYMMIIPAVVLHIFIEIYHQICFRLYKIPLCKYKDHFCFNRSHLPYLNWFEKINCAYCSYFNCLISYSREIAGRTERFWCPIKYAMHRKDPHTEYENFIGYLEGKELREKWKELRKFEKPDKK